MFTTAGEEMPSCPPVTVGAPVAFGILCRERRPGSTGSNRTTKITSGREADSRAGPVVRVIVECEGKGTELVNVTPSRALRAMENNMTGAETGIGRRAEIGRRAAGLQPLASAPW